VLPTSRLVGQRPQPSAGRAESETAIKISEMPGEMLIPKCEIC